MFGKLMSVPDALLGQYARLAADLDDAAIREVDDAISDGGPAAGAAKRAVAHTVVALYHGDDAAAGAEKSFDRRFKEHKPPEEIAEATIPSNAIDGEKVYLPRVLVELGLASSGSEARRLIAQRGVRINGEVAIGEEFALGDLIGAVLQVGKRRFVRLRG